MHKIEQYALTCGVKIDSPHIEKNYYPYCSEKYIVLHACHGDKFKFYHYYQDVIDFINPYLKKENIKVLLLGDSPDWTIEGCDQISDASLRQQAYLIEGCSLFFGPESFLLNVASSEDKKIVSIHGSMHSNYVKPFWGSPDNQICLNTEEENLKPNLLVSKYIDNINKIKPEKIAKSILDLLEIKNDLEKISTIYTGRNYSSTSLCIIPDTVIDGKQFDNKPGNIMGHEYFDETNIIKIANERKVNLFLNKQINIKLLELVKHNINQINFYVSLDDDENYFSEISNLGIPLKLITKDSENLSKLRINFFDWEVFLITPRSKKDIDNHEKICNNTKYKSSQILVSNNKIYRSKAAWKQNLIDQDTIIDSPDFWEESESFMLYNE